MGRMGLAQTLSPWGLADSWLLRRWLAGEPGSEILDPHEGDEKGGADDPADCCHQHAG